MKHKVIFLLILVVMVFLMGFITPAVSSSPATAECIGKLEPDGRCTWRFVDPTYRIVCYVTAGTGQNCFEY